MPSNLRWSTSHTLLALIVLALAVRMLLAVMVPLTDTTEARYADIARMMAQNNDWITPWFAPGEPFWGKPPLSFWLQAISFKLFGVNEFAPRFPALLFTLITAMLIYRGSGFLSPASAHDQKAVGLLAVLIYLSMALPFVSAGTVMTDPYLVAATTLTLVSLMAVLREQGRYWRWLFFVGIGIGLLAKGPIAIILTGLPVLVWLLVTRQWRLLWQRLPWVRGSLLCLAIAAPWYWLAELKTPGFLNYFLIGEHINRFLVTDWPGDRYGDAHDVAHGMIWVYLLQAVVPWGLIPLWRMLVAWRAGEIWPSDLRTSQASGPGMRVLVLAAVLAPALFFTLSSNILWTYVLPGLPFLAMAVAATSAPWVFQSRLRLNSLALFVPVLALVVGLAAWQRPELVSTEKYLLRAASAMRSVNTDLVFVDKLPFSARFYSDGEATLLMRNELDTYLQDCPDALLAVRRKHADLIARLQPHYPELGASADYRLFRSSPSRCPAGAAE